MTYYLLLGEATRTHPILHCTARLVQQEGTRATELQRAHQLAVGMLLRLPLAVSNSGLLTKRGSSKTLTLTVFYFISAMHLCKTRPIRCGLSPCSSLPEKSPPLQATLLFNSSSNGNKSCSKNELKRNTTTTQDH